MATSGLMARYATLRYALYRRRYCLSVTSKLGLALGMSCLTGLLAQIRIMLPWTPVPITGQTFAVLLAGVFLGRWWGGVSQAIYVGLGICGIPWFAGHHAGLAAIAGPTGGYLLGFILASMLIGNLIEASTRLRNFVPMLLLMVIANFGVIHVLGLFHLGLWLKLSGGSTPSPGELIRLGMLPFILGDFVKIVAAATAGCAVIPKQDYRQG